MGEQAGKGRDLGSQRLDLQSLGGLQVLLEFLEKTLVIISIEKGDRPEEGNTYRDLGNIYFALGDFRKAMEYHEKRLKIAIEIGDRAGGGRAYRNLGIAYFSLGDFRKAIEYHEKHLKIAIEIGDRAGEGRGYGNLGNAYMSLGDFQKAIEYSGKHLKIAIEVGDRAGEGGAYGNIGYHYMLLGDFQKAIDYLKKGKKIAIEIGDRAEEGKAYHTIGNVYSRLGQFDIAVGNFVSAVDVFNTLRSLFKSEGDWKMKFRDMREVTYTSLWRSLLRIGKINEVLLAADQGRAQALYANLLIQCGLASPSSCAKFESKETASIKPLWEATRRNERLECEGINTKLFTWKT